jgi:hypothetical protein
MMEEEGLSSAEYLRRVSQEMKMVRQMMAKVVNYMVEAEAEVSEKMRRFMMYMHDVHDVSYMYEERGLAIPPWLLREMERCDDRYRQLLTEAHSDDGTFEKVRREMARDQHNRWDHTRLLPAQATHKENRDETRTSTNGSERSPSGSEVRGD